MSLLDFDPYQFEKLETEGVPVYWKHLPQVRQMMEMRVLVLAGARHDPPGQEGLAHFMEHLPLNGCVGWPSFDAVWDQGEDTFNGSLNANTSMERTVYEGRVNRRDLMNAAQFLGSLAAQPLFADLDREKGVIRSEIWRKYGTPRRVELLKRTLVSQFHDHRFGRSDVLGWIETTGQLQVEDFQTFHHTHYHRGNLRIVLTGELAFPDVEQVARAIVDQFPVARESNPRLAPLSSWPQAKEGRIQISTREYFGTPDAPQTEIACSRVSPSGDPESYLMLRKMLWQLLFRRIRGHLGEIYSPQIKSRQENDLRATSITLSVPPEHAATTERVILEVLRDIATDHPEARQSFANKKRQRLEGLLYLEYQGGKVADEAVNELVLRDRIVTLEETIQEVETVSYESVAELVRREFDSSLLSWLIVTP